MLLEIVGFLVLLIGGLVFMAESTKRLEIGVIASLLLIILGLWIITDNIQVQTGTSISATEINTINGLNSGNLNGSSGWTSIDNTTSATVYAEGSNTTSSSSISITRTETDSKVFTDIPTTPIFPIHQLIAIVFIFLGLMGAFEYGMNLTMSNRS